MRSLTDEHSPLLGQPHEEQGDGQRRADVLVSTTKRTWASYINPLLTRRPKRFFEFGDVAVVPSFVKYRVQAMLAAQWTHKLPIIQKSSPADMAASLLLRALENVDNRSDSKLSVVDFCSGGGGPTPNIEKLVNARRRGQSRSPIPFVLTDIHPQLDSWIKYSSESANLSFIPQPVDATDPPKAVKSQSSSTANSSSPYRSDTQVYRLYCLAFHHFNDPLARKVLRSSMESSDGFAIVELQDRHLSSLILMLLDFILIFVVTLPWFWRDPIQLLFTYVIPIMPFIMSFDGLVSCLRTRTFREVLALIDTAVSGSARAKANRISTEMDEDGRVIQVAKRQDWVLKGGRQMHTWPFGHMNWIIGYKSPEV